MLANFSRVSVSSRSGVDCAMIPAPPVSSSAGYPETRNAALTPHRSAYLPAAGLRLNRAPAAFFNLHDRVEGRFLGIPDAVIDGNSTVNASRASLSSASWPLTPDPRCWTLPRWRTDIKSSTTTLPGWQTASSSAMASLTERICSSTSLPSCSSSSHLPDYAPYRPCDRGCPPAVQ